MQKSNKTNIKNTIATLPNFCRSSVLYLTIVTSILLACLLALLAPNWHANFWLNFSHSSIFVLWVSLSSIGSLCLIKSKLPNLSIKFFPFISMGVVLIFTFLYSLIVTSYFSVDFSVWFILRNLAVGLLVGGIFFRFYFLQEQSVSVIKSEAEARVQALQSRIHPHFLFNSLNTIANLASIDPQKTEDSILDLADIFRASMRRADRLIPFKDEQSLCTQYLNLEKQRLGDKLKFEWRTETINQDLLFPPLLLQPVIENAVLHGVQARHDGGTIVITGVSFKNYIQLEITNPMPNDEQAVHNGNSLALKNISQRLEVLYSAKASMNYHHTQDTFYCIIKIPKSFETLESIVTKE